MMAEIHMYLFGKCRKILEKTMENVSFSFEMLKPLFRVAFISNFNFKEKRRETEAVGMQRLKRRRRRSGRKGKTAGAAN